MNLQCLPYAQSGLGERGQPGIRSYFLTLRAFVLYSEFLHETGHRMIRLSNDEPTGV